MVQDLMPPEGTKAPKFEEKTPRELCTENHRELRKQAEEWIRNTASSCSVAVTLIKINRIWSHMEDFCW